MNEDKKNKIIIGILLGIIVVGIIIGIVVIAGKDRQLKEQYNSMSEGIEMPKDAPNNENPSSSIQTH